MSKIKDKATWYGKDIDKMTKAELIEALYDMDKMMREERKDHHRQIEFWASIKPKKKWWQL